MTQKKLLCVTEFRSMTVYNALLGRNRTASQTLACTHASIFRVENVFNAYVNYKHTLSKDIHSYSKVNLLQEKVAACCDLPKMRTLPLFLLRLQYLNSQPS